MNNISTTTALYGVIGSPIKHSLSPFIFNFLFKEVGIDAVYLAFEALSVSALIQSMRTLGIGGFSITLPHKHQAVSFMDELDPLASTLGAINTAVNRNGVLKGYNFDGLAALRALERQLPNWREKSILILGAGGSAMGIAQTIVQDHNFKNRVGIASRNREKGETLVSQLKLSGGATEWLALERLQKNLPSASQLDYEIVIQTTPLGMERAEQMDSETLPMKIENLSQHAFVYDIIYTPLRTRFLQIAAAQGLQTLSGLEMFIEQAMMQFEVFTEKSLPSELRDDLYKLVTAKLLAMNV